MAIEKNGTKQKNKPVILVVDDQPQNIELLEAYLVPQGYDVVKAVNGAEALETLSAIKIDMILLDVTMPGMDGFEVTRRVRSDDKNCQLPIIIVTALREREARVKGIEAGCDDFLSKPVDKTELLARVQSLLKVKAYNDLASNYRKELEVTQKSTDEALEYAESIINTVREPLIVLGHDLRVITASRSFYETFEVKPEETVGQLIYNLGNKQWDIPKLRELLETILPQKTTFDNYEVEHEFSTIGRRVMLLNARQIQRLLGKESIILLAIEDITERKKIEGALQTLEDKYHLLMEKTLVISEETFRLVVESLIVGITVTDLQGTILQPNKAFVLLHGFRSKEEVIGRNILELINKIDHKKAQENMSKLEMEGYFKDVEFILLKVDGSSFSAELSAAAIKDKSGNTQSIVFLTRDITERKQAEQALLQNEEKYRTLFETMLQGVVYEDAEGYIFSVNPAAERILGLTHDQVLGRTSTDPRWKAIHEDGSDFTGDMHPAIVALRTGKEVRNVIMGVFHPGENKYVWININAIPQFKQGETKPHQVYTTFEDITERKQAEEDLKQSEEKYRRLFEAARDGILILKVETGTVVDVNPFMVEMIGFSREQLLDKKIWELGFLKDIVANKENFEELKRQKYIKYENLALETATGQRIQVEFVSHLYEVGNQQVIQCNIRDISERRRLEVERDKFTKELVEKNTELERFTYTVSHDLKSPLVTVKTFLGYLKHDIVATDQLRIENDMFYMNSAADKMGKLLEELLEMSRVGRIVNLPVKVTFDQLVEDTLSITAGRIEGKGVQVNLHKEPVTLFGDRTRLVEIWQNLVDNAVKFMGDQPSPQIDIGLEHQGSETVFFVRDNGVGIEPQYQSKLFNLFEKINPRTEGTGMGLAITKRIVELYQGRIWVESKGEGRGTCFWFTLPGALKDKDKGG